MNWSLRAMFMLIATVAVALYVIRGSYGYYILDLGLFILLTTVAMVGAIPAKSMFRPGFIGTSIFGALYFVFVLKAGFGIDTNNEANALLGNARLGMRLLGLSFLASQFCAMIIWPRNEMDMKNEETNGSK
jgi:hypothetical protein